MALENGDSRPAANGPAAGSTERAVRERAARTSSNHDAGATNPIQPQQFGLGCESNFVVATNQCALASEKRGAFVCQSANAPALSRCASKEEIFVTSRFSKASDGGENGGFGGCGGGSNAKAERFFSSSREQQSARPHAARGPAGCDGGGATDLASAASPWQARSIVDFKLDANCAQGGQSRATQGVAARQQASKKPQGQKGNGGASSTQERNIGAAADDEPWRLPSAAQARLSSYLKNVASKWRQSFSSNSSKCVSGDEDESKTRLNRIMKQRYVLFLFIVSLLMVACLLATLVISRGVGQLDQEESARSQQLKSAKAAEEALEVRQVELVDLVECDKTFGYTRWRLQVRVPKSAPLYAQQNRFARSAAAPAAPPPPESAHSSDQVNDGQPISAAAPAALSSTNAAATSAIGEPEESESRDPNERYFLTSTSEFVSEANQSDDNNKNNEPELGGQSAPNAQNQLMTEMRTTNAIRRTRDNSRAQPAPEAAQSRDLNSFEANPSSATLDPLDPLQLAANEMRLALDDEQSVNKTIVDCFLVDTEKRYEQRLAVEAKHKRLASTRRVGLDKMLAVIQACRSLTWATLKVTHHGERRSSSGGEQLTSRGVTTTTTSARPNPLVDVIRPAERRTTPKPGEGTLPPSDPFANLFGMLNFWEAPQRTPNGPVLTTRRPEIGGITQQPPTTTTTTTTTSSQQGRDSKQARVVDTKLLLRPNAAAPAAAANFATEEDEARRASYLNMGMSMVSGIVPNTLWCGLGDRAANYSELGNEFQVDSCCRAHDHCPIRLKPFTADYGIINWSMSTRSHCDCDLDFSECLERVNTSLSNVIKVLYFRFVGLQCIDIERQNAAREESGTTSIQPTAQ